MLGPPRPRANVRAPIVTKNRYANFEEPRLSLRSQLGIELIGGDDKFSLEDIVRLKHDYRALLADRVKADLIAAVRANKPSAEAEAAAWSDPLDIGPISTTCRRKSPSK